MVVKTTYQRRYVRVYYQMRTGFLRSTVYCTGDKVGVPYALKANRRMNNNNTSCRKDKVDEFLNQVRSYINDLELKGVKLPLAFVNVWVLEKLNKSYSDFKTTVYANFRTDKKAYTFETLSFSILDEYRRRKEQGNSFKKEKAYFTSKKP